MNEKRLVSVIYADLVGFTSRSHGTDPEVVRALQRPFHARARAEIDAHGGSVEKFIGDAVVAVFGVVEQEGNDQERAVRAALRIPELVADLNEAEPALDLAVRVGVNSEWVLVGGEGDAGGVGLVSGDIVNIAGALQGAAPVNGVAVCQTTYERTRRRFRYAGLDAIPLPGRVERAPVWQPRAPSRRARRAQPEDVVVHAPVELEERREVSVLFADLVDFSLRSSSGDSEEMRALLRPYFGRIKQEIELYGGTVEKFLGDAVMAVFGAPVARGDDAERAVRAALRLPYVVVELNEDDAFREVAVRAAVNTGDVVVALGARFEEGEGLVTGDAVNTAARLLGAAPVGTVVVGQTTYEATHDVVTYEELPSVVVKGKPEPLAVHRATAVRADTDIGQTRDTPFVGRGAELALLKGTYARVLQERAPQTIVLVGDAGIGKTRLIREFRAYVSEQRELAVWRQGRCPPYGPGVAFWALGEIVKTQTGILESDTAAEAGTKLATAVRTLTGAAGEREWLTARLAPLVGAQVDGCPERLERDEAFAAWRRFLELVAEQRPLVCVIDDLHCAGEGLLNFLEHLADSAGRVPLLVLCATRPGLFERHPAWGRRRANLTQTMLAALEDDEIERLAAALVDGAGASVAASARGNPLYAVEAARLLREADGTAPPDALADVIAGRLDRLSPELRRPLEDGAVVGNTFWAGAVGALAGISAQEACRALDELARSELLHAEPVASFSGEAEYSFLHSLVRDAVDAGLSAGDRAAKHHQAAVWVEGAVRDRVEHHAGVLANHLSRARDAALEAGSPDAARLAEEADRFLARAREHARRLGFDEADRLPAAAAEQPDAALAAVHDQYLATWAYEAGGIERFLAPRYQGLEEGEGGFRAFSRDEALVRAAGSPGLRVEARQRMIVTRGEREAAVCYERALDDEGDGVPGPFLLEIWRRHEDGWLLEREVVVPGPATP